MKNNKLLKTNLLISIILIIGFLLTGFFSYQANYQASLDNIEQVSELTAEGIYYQLTAMFTKPVNTSLTMAHDSLLVEHLSKEAESLNDGDYIQTTKEYLEAYQKKYGFDSVFLVSTATSRYYNFNGYDRVLTRGDKENTWYYDFLDSDSTYNLNVDNDEVTGANDEITMFINCKVNRPDGTVIGVVGVGIRINSLKDMLNRYEENFGLKASLINQNGDIEISTVHTGYERINWFALYDQKGIQEKVLGAQNSTSNLETWTVNDDGNTRSYVVSRYIPDLSWYLLVEQDTEALITKMRIQTYQTCAILAIIIFIILAVITTVIKNFNLQITQLIEERQRIFKEATEQLYDNIYELNITKNCIVGKHTEQYFESLGAKNLPYHEGLRVIAESQIKEEYREGYVATFTPANVMREFESGNNHLQYDFMITDDGACYYWMRIDAYIFPSKEDNSIHMFTYRKNIDDQKRKELQLEKDEMTGFYTKKATERMIDRLLSENPDGMYALFILDIDHFKQANDRFGHVFGDFCIKKFTNIIKTQFKESDIFGRMGGDEFAVFIPIQDGDWLKAKAKELSHALDTSCTEQDASWHMSASIGVAIAPTHGRNFITLFQKADTALYHAKQGGRNSFTFYSETTEEIE